MKKKLLFIICTAVLLVGYILGMFFPIKNIMPIIDENSPKITAYEYHALFVNWLLVIVTFLTVCVALLKEEIIKFFRHPKIVVLKDNNCLKENLSEVEQDGKFATRYYYNVRIENSGNVEARNIDIIIVSVKYKNSVVENEIPIKNRHICLSDMDSGKILAPSMITEAILFSIENESLVQNVQNESKNNSNNSSCVLRIGNNKIKNEYYQGEIKLSIQVYCDGGYKDTRVIKIKWDGVWEDRLDDIKKNHISIEEV